MGDFCLTIWILKDIIYIKTQTMNLIEFKLEKGTVFINPDKIVSVSKKQDGKTEITTINYNEFYMIDENIDDVLIKLRHLVEYNFFKI